MNRRTFLATIGVPTTGVLAGCTTFHTTNSEPRLSCADNVTKNTNGYQPSTKRWPSIYGNAQNTSHKPTLNGPDGCPTLQWNWQYTKDIGSGSGMHTSPIIGSDTIYLSDETLYYVDDSGNTSNNSSLIALNAKTGTERWRHNAGFSPESTPVLHNNTIYLPGNGEFAAVDITTQETLWKCNLVSHGINSNSKFFESPVVSLDNILYAANDAGELFALDGKSGDVLWQFAAPGMNPDNISDDSADIVREAKLTGAFYSPLGLSEDTVYGATFGNAVHAVNRHTGELRWTYRLPLLTKHDRPHAPTVADGEVYIGTNAGLFYVLDAATGKQRWKYTAKGFADGMSPAVDDTYVYITAGESVPETELHAINRITHNVEWTTPVGHVHTGPAIDQENVYVGQGTILLAIDKQTGNEQWWFDLGSGTYSAPAIANGAVYMADTDGNVYALW